MTSKEAFTDEEWIRVRRAPMVAGMAITIADPGGPIEISKEGMATLRSATVPPSQEELLASIALDITAMTQRKENPLHGFKPEDPATMGQAVLDELTAAVGIAAGKATPEETDAFRGWLVTTAQAAADAAKEGGFMGFGAELISQREADMIERVRAAVGTS